MSKMLRRPPSTVPASIAASAGERRTASTAVIAAWSGWANTVSVASSQESCDEGRARVPMPEARDRSAAPATRSKIAAVRCMPDSPSIIAWCTFISVAM